LPILAVLIANWLDIDMHVYNDLQMIFSTRRKMDTKWPTSIYNELWTRHPVLPLDIRHHQRHHASIVILEAQGLFHLALLNS
jgi:hypothetical protein